MNDGLLRILLVKSRSLYKKFLVLLLGSYCLDLTGMYVANVRGKLYDFGAVTRVFSLFFLVYAAVKLWDKVSSEEVFFQPYTNRTKVISISVVHIINLVVFFVENVLLSSLFSVLKGYIDSDFIIVKLRNVINVEYIIYSLLTWVAIGAVMLGCYAVMREFAKFIGKIIIILISVLLFFMPIYVPMFLKDESSLGILIKSFTYFSSTNDNVVLFVTGSFIGSILLLSLAMLMSSRNSVVSISKTQYAQNFATIWIVVYIYVGGMAAAMESYIDDTSEFIVQDNLLELSENNEVLISEKSISYVPERVSNLYEAYVVCETRNTVSCRNLSSAKESGLVSEDRELKSGEGIMLIAACNDKRFTKDYQELLDSAVVDSKYNIEFKSVLFNNGLSPKKLTKFRLEDPDYISVYIIYSDDDKEFIKEDEDENFDDLEEYEF